MAGKNHVPYGQGNGFPYIFLKIDDEVCNIIIAMSKCHHLIRVSNTLQFFNDLISNKENKVKLNSFKFQCCVVTEEDGKSMVGKRYWSHFMKRNGHRLNHVKPKKFGIDRTNWCKYGAFVDMYDSIEKALIEEKFMTVLEEPEL